MKRLPEKCPRNWCGGELIFSVTGDAGYNESLRAWCEYCRWEGYWKLANLRGDEES